MTQEKQLMQVRKGTHLQILAGVVVPSTEYNEKISSEEFNKRVKRARTYFAQFGGYTSVKAVGGWIEKTEGLITEDSMIVESYLTKEQWIRNKNKIRAWIREKNKSWKQHAMAMLLEDDMFILE